MSAEIRQAKRCWTCLGRIGLNDVQVAARFRAERKRVFEWRQRFPFEAPTTLSDLRLYCVRCLFRLGLGTKKAMAATGLPKTTVSRFAKQQRLTDAKAAAEKSQRDREQRKANATGWMTDAWNAEWKDALDIFDLQHWAKHPAITDGRTPAMVAYYKNIEAARERSRVNAKRRYYTMPRGSAEHIKRALRSRVYNSIKRNLRGAAQRRPRSKTQPTMLLVGCTIDQLMEHLEAMFLPGMNWANYGRWHIDHVRPCASFDLSDARQQQEYFHWTNLQPLWASDNIRKGDSLLHFNDNNAFCIPPATSILSA